MRSEKAGDPPAFFIVLSALPAMRQIEAADAGTLHKSLVSARENRRNAGRQAGERVRDIRVNRYVPLQPIAL